MSFSLYERKGKRDWLREKNDRKKKEKKKKERERWREKREKKRKRQEESLLRLSYDIGNTWN